MSLFDHLPREKAEKVIEAAHERAGGELQNYLDGYSPWLIVDKLKASELDESDFDWLKVIIARVYLEGFEDGLKAGKEE